jgi:hypothetical protein
MTRNYSYLSIHRLVSIALIVVAVISIFSYVSLTVATVFATAGRSKAAIEAATLTSHIGDLEGNYLTLGNSITAAEATARGYVVPKQVTLTVAPAAQVTLSIRTR